MNKIFLGSMIALLSLEQSTFCFFALSSEFSRIGSAFATLNPEQSRAIKIVGGGMLCAVLGCSGLGSFLFFRDRLRKKDSFFRDRLREKDSDYSYSLRLKDAYAVVLREVLKGFGVLNHFNNINTGVFTLAYGDNSIKNLGLGMELPESVSAFISQAFEAFKEAQTS